ncbi:unnamed protein product [Spodoptera littoralis]|uniref:Attacin C-terminal domain-containing protein n=1 Tax=Spodoptera littoralis TaxID=7109 RepID=A0A9P0I9D7_SPOLI|nr:unnamed protein product [Spodoptera littoralis]CAH1641760.1 unnamed protein product [Spodoptera littoralis]
MEGFNARLPFASTNNNVFSAIGGANFDANRHLSSATYGLAMDNAITAAGHANLFHNQNHDLTANAFLSRNMPTIPQVPNFNTVGGGLDYMFNTIAYEELMIDLSTVLRKASEFTVIKV